MKKLLIVCLMYAICCIPLQSKAQLLGKWILPTMANSETHQTLLLSFNAENSIEYNVLQHQIDDANFCDIAAGAYNPSYDLEFDVLNALLFRQNTPYSWNFLCTQLITNFHPEYQIINRPGYTDHFYSFYTGTDLDDALKEKFAYNEIWFQNATPQFSCHNYLSGGIQQGNLIGFAITPEEDSERRIYASIFTDGTNPAGLYEWTITENGVNNPNIVIDATNSSFNNEDFSAYNLELKTEPNDDIIIAWSSQREDICDMIYVVRDGSEDTIGVHKGRIGGLEFSTFKPNVLYVSCSDEGIIELDYNTDTILSTLPNSSNFGHTFLQTAPDGHIYAVSDNGNYLGRINQNDGMFDSETFQIPGYPWNFVSTYRMFDGEKYFILPENQRTYNPLIVTVDTVPESCPGYADGSAIICVSGGNPAAPPDPGYNITCTGPGGNSIDYDYFDPATGCFHFENLTAGVYTFNITDDIGTFYEGSFTIGDTYYDTDIIVIDYDLAWTDHYADQYRIEFLLLIKDNAVLDIDNTILEFGPNGKVIVEPGSRINADNSVFRNLNCEPYYKWKGIEVWGDKYAHQYNIQGVCAQGYLYLNNSTVMHAENGVSLWAEEDRLWNTAGGIVKAVQSDFIDNTRAVHFVPYENTFPPTGEPCNNLSSFKLCTFSLDENYIDHTMFYKHVDLHGVNGIKFYGCNFSLNASSGVSPWNNGIASYGSKFKIDAGCDQSIVPCPEQYIVPSTFSGFYRAVSAHGPMEDLKTYEIWNSEFTNNTIGIYNIEVGNAVMVDNDFYVGYNGTDDNTDCANVAGSGIEIFHANGYAIEKNYFTKQQDAPPGHYVGVRLDSTLSHADEVYNNVFTGLSVGNLAESENRSVFTNDHTGVAYLCNTNSYNNYDFHVAENSWIKGFMGSDVLPSGNTLSQPSQGVELQFRNDYTQEINYYWYDDDEHPLQELTLYSNYVSPFPVSVENTCPDHYGGGGTGINVVLSSAEKSTKEQAYDQNMIDYTLTLDLINTLKDGGDTPLMEHEIETAWPDEMWILRADLLANSPHLSFEVLKDVADRTDVFPESVQFDIFAANPDEMNYDFLTYLETKTQPMPQYMVDMLAQVGQGTSYKTVLKNQMATYWGKAVNAAQDIIRSELFDSITDMNEVRLWLGNIGGYQADKQIIASYLQQGDYTSAQNLLTQLPSTYSLSGDDLLAYNDYNTLMQMQINLMQQGRSIFDFDSSELATVNMLATQGYGSAKKQAQSILEYAYDEHYYDCPDLPEGIALKQQHSASFSNDQDVIKISLKPNPADTWVAIDYALPFSTDEGMMYIIDISGKTIESINLSQNKGQKVVDTRKIPAGIYVFRIESLGYLNSKKLVIR